MTTDSGEPLEAAEPHTPKRARRHSDLPFVDDLRAVIRGVRATARKALRDARAEARRARDDAWSHYDELTKHRRDR